MGLGALGGALALRYDRSPWWGFLLPLLVDAGTPALRDLVDPLATMTAVGLLAAWLLRWSPWVVGIWALSAVLSREQNVLIVLIVLLQALTGRRWKVAFAASFGWLVWTATLKGVYGTWPFVPGNLDPFLTGVFSITRHRAIIHTTGMVLLLVQVGVSLSMPFFRAEPTSALVALAGAVLALFGGEFIFAAWESYSRVFLWMPLGIWLWSLSSGRRWPVLLIAPWAMWPGVALLQAWRAVGA